MENFYKEIKERMKFLEAIESTPEIEARKSELQLAIIRVQQILLEGIGNEKKFGKHHLKHAFYDGMLYGKNELPVVNEFDFTGKPEILPFDVWYKKLHE